MKDLSQLKSLLDFNLIDTAYHTDEMFRNVNISIPQQTQSTDTDQSPQNELDKLIRLCYLQSERLQKHDYFLNMCEMHVNDLNDLQQVTIFNINESARNNYSRHLAALKKISEQQHDIRMEFKHYEAYLSSKNINNEYIFDTLKKIVDQVANNNPASEDLKLLQEFIELVKYNSLHWQELQQHNYKEWLELITYNDIKINDILTTTNSINLKNSMIQDLIAQSDQKIQALQRHNEQKFSYITQYNEQAYRKLSEHESSTYLIAFKEWWTDLKNENETTTRVLRESFNKELTNWNILRDYNKTQLLQLNKNKFAPSWINFQNICKTTDIYPRATEIQKDLHSILRFWHLNNPAINLTLTYQIFSAINFYQEFKRQHFHINYGPTSIYANFIKSLNNTPNQPPSYGQSMVLTNGSRNASTHQHHNAFHTSTTSPLQELQLYKSPLEQELDKLITHNFEQSKKLLMNNNYIYLANYHRTNIHLLNLSRFFNPEDSLDTFYKKQAELLNTCLEQQQNILVSQEGKELSMYFTDKFNKKIFDDLQQYNYQKLTQIEETIQYYEMKNIVEKINSNDALFLRSFLDKFRIINKNWEDLQHFNYESWLQLLLTNNAQCQAIMTDPNANEQNHKILYYTQQNNEFLAHIQKQNEVIWQKIQSYTKALSDALSDYTNNNPKQASQYEEWLNQIQKDNNLMYSYIERHYSKELEQWNLLQQDNLEQMRQLGTIDGNQFQVWKSLILPLDSNDTPEIRVQKLYDLVKSWHDKNPDIDQTLIYQTFAATQCYAAMTHSQPAIDLLTNRIISAIVDTPIVATAGIGHVTGLSQTTTAVSAQPPQAATFDLQAAVSVLAQPSVNATTVFAQPSRPFNANNYIISGGQQHHQQARRQQHHQQARRQQQQAWGQQYQQQAWGQQYQQQAWGQQYQQQAWGQQYQQQHAGFNLNAAPFNPQGNRFARAEYDHVPPRPQAAGMDNPQNNPFLMAPAQPGHVPNQHPASNTNPTREADTLLSSRYINSVIGNRQNNQNNPSR
jgi:hypothetical protein